MHHEEGAEEAQRARLRQMRSPAMNQPASFLGRHTGLGLTVLALIYAALAGYRTAGDFDLGWQLATGRHLVQQREIPSSDVFSYTARGREWIYPVFSGALFYGAWRLGGYAALSLISAAACAAAVALALRSGPWRAGTAALAILAVPPIAIRTAARADLFSTVLFAAFLMLLWRHHSGYGTPLWTLPVLMVAWVNLHLGFIAGLGLIALYVIIEGLELAFPARRQFALLRLRRAVPWLALSVAATLVNPWGARLYAAIARQNRVMTVHQDFLGEWSRVRFSAALTDALLWRGVESAYWWLLALAVVAAALALWQRRLGVPLLLAAAAVASARSVRFQALFALAVVVVAGSVFASAPSLLRLRFQRAFERKKRREAFRQKWSGALGLALLAAMTWLVGVRISDLVSNRYYLSSGEIAAFGAGPSWWYPEAATGFLLREKLPGNVFHDYNIGGYLVWRLAPGYPVFIDGRAVPYGTELFFRHRTLMQLQPDSLEWQRQADALGINTLIFSVGRYAGLGSIPLRQYCDSQTWRPVYLDEVAVIFLRKRPENARWLARLELDCSTVPFRPPQSRDRAALYNFYANAGSVLYMLSRDAEALDALERARRLFAHDSNLYLARGQVYQANNQLAEAEREYRLSVELKQTDAAWYALGRTFVAHGRHREAVDAIARAAQRSINPHERYRALGQLYLAMNNPGSALESFDRAMRSSPFVGEAYAHGAEFHAQVAAGRARAWRSLGDLSRAISFQKHAVDAAPLDAARWLELADLYQAQGQASQADEARRRAQELANRP